MKTLLLVLPLLLAGCGEPVNHCAGFAVGQQVAIRGLPGKRVTIANLASHNHGGGICWATVMDDTMKRTGVQLALLQYVDPK